MQEFNSFLIAGLFSLVFSFILLAYGLFTIKKPKTIINFLNSIQPFVKYTESYKKLLLFSGWAAIVLGIMQLIFTATWFWGLAFFRAAIG